MAYSKYFNDFRDSAKNLIGRLTSEGPRVLERIKRQAHVPIRKRQLQKFIGVLVPFIMKFLKSKYYYTDEWTFFLIINTFQFSNFFSYH